MRPEANATFLPKQTVGMKESSVAPVTTSSKDREGDRALASFEVLQKRGSRRPSQITAPRTQLAQCKVPEQAGFLTFHIQIGNKRALRRRELDSCNFINGQSVKF